MFESVVTNINLILFLIYFRRGGTSDSITMGILLPCTAFWLLGCNWKGTKVHRTSHWTYTSIDRAICFQSKNLQGKFILSSFSEVRICLKSLFFHQGFCFILSSLYVNRAVRPCRAIFARTAVKRNTGSILIKYRRFLKAFNKVFKQL